MDDAIAKSLKATLEDKIDQLSSDINKYIRTKEELKKQVALIDIKITQQVGAIDCLKSMVPSLESK